MNKKGSVLVYGMMISLVIIILGLALSPAVLEFTTIAQDNSTGMDCTDAANSNFIKAACVSTDLSLFWFTAGIILIGGSLIGARLVFGSQ